MPMLVEIYSISLYEAFEMVKNFEGTLKQVMQKNLEFFSVRS